MIASKRGPVLVGVATALASAFAFGLTVPVLAWAGAGVGPFATAALLYLGAGFAALAQKPFVRESGSPLGIGSIMPLLVMGLVGAALAPSLLAWGLQHSDPATSALLLNAEAIWTALIARAVFRESLGGRVRAAVALMSIGGCILALRVEGAGGLRPLGVAAVIGATLAWAVDNSASRKLAERKPSTVVALKGAIGASATLVLAYVFGEHAPQAWQVAALLGAGATGYGASLRLYLLAQRKLGAARTASVFSVAPFIGAALGLLVAPAVPDWKLLLAAGLFAFGVWLHASERHAHHHRHAAIDHDHPHRHDDAHHDHQHHEAVAGEHSHRHRHEPLEHAHEHGPDIHHGHRH